MHIPAIAKNKHALVIVAIALIAIALLPQLPKAFASSGNGQWHIDRPGRGFQLNDRTENNSVDDEASVGIGVDFQSYSDNAAGPPFYGIYDGFTLPVVVTANTRKTVNYASIRYGGLVSGFPNTQGWPDTGICTDDGGVWEDLGFDFYFYGGPGPHPSACYSEVWISSNGFISFQDALTSPSLKYGAATPNAVIAPYWTDLDPTGGGHVKYLAIGSPTDSFWVVWENVLNKANGQRETFALWLDGSHRSPTETRGQNDIHFLYQNIHSYSQGAVVVEDQDGYRGFSPLPDGMGSTLHAPSDEIKIYGISDAVEIRKLDIVCSKSDGQAEINMLTDNTIMKGYNMKFASATEDPGGIYTHALTGSATMLISIGAWHLNPLCGLMFDTTMLTMALAGEYAKEHYPAQDPATLNAGQGDNIAYANVSAYYSGDYLWPVDATLGDVIQWVFTDQSDNQPHSMTITAVLEYHSYLHGDRTLSTSVVLQVEPDVGNTLTTARTIGLGSNEWSIDNIDSKDVFKIYVDSDYLLSLTMQPPNDGKFDLYLYAPGSNENSQPIASTTNPGNSSVSIEYSTATSGIYYVKAKQTYWEGHLNEGFYWLTVDVTSGGGGCPTLFVWGGSHFVMDNDLLPGSEVGNGSDTNDFYKMEQSPRPIRQGTVSSSYAFQISEFENEHDYIDQVELIAVDHSPNASVAVTPEGKIVTYANPACPFTCVDNNGTNRLNEISRMDGEISDPTTYFQGSEGNWLVLDFGRVTAGNANLILRDDYKCMDVCIDVQVPDENGSWQTVEVLHPRNFWAMEAVNMSSYLPANGNFIARLLWTATHRMDYVGLDTSAPVETSISYASPKLAIHSTMGDVTTKLLYDDENCVEIVNGQTVTIAFTLPNKTRGTTRDFVFFTNGYYYTITP